MKKPLYLIGALGLVVAAGSSYLISNSLDVSNASVASYDIDKAPAQATSSSDLVSNHENTLTSEKQLITTSEADNFVGELIQKLIGTYSDTIHLLHIQASLIQVKEFVLKRYPDKGEDIFTNIIHSAFPDHATGILSLLANLGVYQEWLLANQSDLMAMEDQLQKGTIWEKRRSIFGADAEKIWAHELAEMSEQQTAMQQVIKTLNEAHDIPLEEKLYQLQTAIDEQLAGTVQNAAISGGVVSQVFFTLDSVQTELAAMDSDTRQSKINDVRALLGLNDEQIKRLEAQDLKREERWTNGLAYMEERQNLLASANEFTQEAELNELRERYFGRDAITIKREEESDFWRYSRPRVYGVN